MVGLLVRLLVFGLLVQLLSRFAVVLVRSEMAGAGGNQLNFLQAAVLQHLFGGGAPAAAAPAAAAPAAPAVAPGGLQPAQVTHVFMMPPNIPTGTLTAQQITQLSGYVQAAQTSLANRGTVHEEPLNNMIDQIGDSLRLAHLIISQYGARLPVQQQQNNHLWLQMLETLMTTNGVPIPQNAGPPVAGAVPPAGAAPPAGAGAVPPAAPGAPAPPAGIGLGAVLAAMAPPVPALAGAGPPPAPAAPVNPGLGPTGLPLGISIYKSLGPAAARPMPPADPALQANMMVTLQVPAIAGGGAPPAPAATATAVDTFRQAMWTFYDTLINASFYPAHLPAHEPQFRNFMEQTRGATIDLNGIQSIPQMDAVFDPIRAAARDVITDGGVAAACPPIIEQNFLVAYNAMKAALPGGLTGPMIQSIGRFLNHTLLRALDNCLIRAATTLKALADAAATQLHGTLAAQIAAAGADPAHNRMLTVLNASTQHLRTSIDAALDPQNQQIAGPAGMVNMFSHAYTHHRRTIHNTKAHHYAALAGDPVVARADELVRYLEEMIYYLA